MVLDFESLKKEEVKEKESLPWEITIKKANNGFICSWKEADEEDYIRTNQQVFEEEEETEDSLEELKNMQKVLDFIKEHFGVHYSKHNKNNLIIKIEEGEKDEN